MVVRPPQSGTFHAGLERLSDRPFRLGGAVSFGIQQLPTAAAAVAGTALGRNVQVSARQVFVERIADQHVRQVGCVAELEPRVVPDAQRYETRVPVPAVADGRLHDVGCLRAVGWFGVAFGNGIDEHFEPVAGLQVRCEFYLDG